MMTRCASFACVVLVAAEGALTGHGKPMLEPPRAPRELQRAPPPVPAPHLSVFNDGEHWVLLEELRYEMANTGLTIAVPRGFVTDLASIPAPIQPVISVMGRHGRAAIVHDYLYWQQECTREQADQIMLIAMLESGVTQDDMFGIHLALRLFGSGAWAGNRNERSTGLPRRVPNPDVLPPLAEWQAFRRQLFASGVRPDAVAVIRPAYCEAAMKLRLHQ